MSILALDMATRVGWAHASGDSGVLQLPAKRTGETNGRRFNAFFRWLSDMSDLYQYDAVVYEQAHHRGGPPTRLAVGLVAVVEMHAEHLGLRCKAYHSATIKKHATGSGRADKPAMLAAAQRRCPGREFIDDNEVDALFLIDLALCDLAPSSPVEHEA